MSNANETLERIKSLYNYGRQINEDNNKRTLATLEYHEIGADGKSYGIIRECNKYYIKSAPADKEMLAEAYDYIGGFCNKKDYEYTSYANASKHFGLKMASINEACEGKVIVENLNPFANNNQIMTEASQTMKDEVARARQIMYNAAMIMNESNIPTPTISRANDTVMYNGKNPEAENGKTGAKAEGSTEGKATLDKDFNKKTNGVDKKVGPFDQNAQASKDQLKEGDDCGCASGNCKKEKFGCDWGSNGMGKGQDPAQIGWEMDGQQKVNEGEENDWGSKGLPSAPGVGEADTDHNNDPFNKSINEGDDLDNDTDVEGDNLPTAGDDEVDMGLDGAEGDVTGGDDLDADGAAEAGADDNFDFGNDSLDADGDTDLDTDTDLDADSDLDTDTDLDSDIDGEDDFGGDDDIQAEIDRLQAELDDLKAQIEGDDNIDADGATDLDTDSDLDTDTDASLNGEGTDEFDTDSADAGMPGDDFDADEGGEFDTDSDLDTDGQGVDVNNDDFGGDDFGTQDGAEGFDDDMDECGNGGCGLTLPKINESKKRKMDAIVESVVRSLLKEDQLHDFGNHPGYRKKPMQLPPTGEDKNEHGRDWNDDSVHSEEPFGSKIGSSAPFDKLVDTITKDVVSQLTKMADGGEKKN